MADSVEELTFEGPAVRTVEELGGHLTFVLGCIVQNMNIESGRVELKVRI